MSSAFFLIDVCPYIIFVVRFIFIVVCSQKELNSSNCNFDDRRKASLGNDIDSLCIVPKNQRLDKLVFCGSMDESLLFSLKIIHLTYQTFFLYSSIQTSTLRLAAIAFSSLFPDLTLSSMVNMKD